VGTWPWALVMLAFNLAMLAIALAMVGAAGQRARRAVEPQATLEAETHEEESHGADAERAPIAVGAH